MPYTLLNALRRAAWTMKGRLLAAGLILGSALAMYIGLYSAIDSLFASRAQWYAELAAADLEVRIVPEDASNVPALAQVPGVVAVEQRLTLPGNIDTPSGGKLYALMVAQSGPPTLNRLRLQSGANLDPAHPDEVVIERSMATHHGLTVGDRFRLNVGKDHYWLKVRGIAVSPEFLIDSANPNFFLPSKGSLGVVYAPYTLIEPRLGYRLVNSLLIDLDPEVASAQAIEQAVQDTLRQRVTIEESLPQARQFGHLYLNLDLGAFKIFVPAIVLIFVVSALVITVFVMMQWIAAKQREVGVMLALGYRPRHIALAFTMPVWLIAAVALSAGLLMSVGLMFGFGHSYAQALGLPDPTLALRPMRVLAGVAGALTLLVLAMLMPLAHLVKLTPAVALRGQVARLSHTRSWLSRLLERLSHALAWRYALRNLQRARLLTLMTGAAVALSLGAALSYFVSLTSFEQSIIQRLQSDDWDLAVDFLAPVWTDELTPLKAQDGVLRTDAFLRGAITLHTPSAVEPSFVLGIDPSSPARTLRMVAGRALQVGDQASLVLERKTAAALGLKVGDRLTVQARNTDWPVTLVGTFSGVLPGESYATLPDAQAWFDMPDQVTGAFLKTRPDTALPARLYQLDRVARVTTKHVLMAEFVHHLKEIASIVYLALGLSLLVAVLFLLATTAFGVLRRQGEYTTLRTLGLSDGTVGGILITEVGLVGVAGCVLAAGVGLLISWGLNGALSTAWFDIDTTVAPRDVLTVLGPALLLVPLTALPPLRTILRTQLATALRHRSLG